MSKTINKKKLYRHSTTFYRKLKQLKYNSEGQNIIKNLNVICKPSNIKEKEQYSEVTKTIIDLDYNEYQNNDFASSAYEENENNLDYLEEPEENSETFTLWLELKKWALKHKTTHSALNDLLRLLKNKGLQLPLDSRTLLDTPCTVSIERMGDGEFWYNGIKNNLMACLPKESQLKRMSLVFNVDGIPPFKSAPLQFWPILFRVEEIPDLKPMAVAIVEKQNLLYRLFLANLLKS